MGNGAFVLLTNLLFSASFTDLCYGFHAFWKYCLDAIDLENVNGFEIDTALYLGALRTRLRISEVPSFEGYRFHGQGKLQTIPDGWRVLKTITRQSLKKMQKNSRADYLGFRGMNTGYLPVPMKPQASRNTTGDLHPDRRAEIPIPASQRSPTATVINPRYKKKTASGSQASSATAGDVQPQPVNHPQNGGDTEPEGKPEPLENQQV